MATPTPAGSGHLAGSGHPAGSGHLAVIGCCSVSSCRRAATRHLVLAAGGRVVAGTLCDHCDRASRLALFLLELEAA